MNISEEEHVRERNENMIPKDFFFCYTLLHLTKKQEGVKPFLSGAGNSSDLKWIYSVLQLVLSTKDMTEIQPSIKKPKHYLP